MPESIGVKLKEARILCDLSVQDVSDRMIQAGFEKASPKTIYSWESGNSKPSTDYFLELCDIYKINDISSFFGYKKAPESEQTDPGESITQEQLVSVLNTLGFLDENGQLSDADMKFLNSAIALLDEWFNG